MNVGRIAVIAAALIGAGVYSLEARAEILLSATDGSHTVTANDLASPGIVSYSGTIGNFLMSFDVGVGFPMIGSPSLATIDLTSLDITSGAAGGVLTVSLTETGFSAKEYSDWFVSTLTGNYVNSHATMNAYLDTSNAAFGTGTLLASGLLDNAAAALTEGPIGGPYSMTEILTITAGPNSLTSLDAMIVDAPEPATLPLLGTALFALATIGWRARRRPVVAI